MGFHGGWGVASTAVFSLTPHPHIETLPILGGGGSSDGSG